MTWKILLNTFKSFSNNRHISKNGGATWQLLPKAVAGKHWLDGPGSDIFLNGNSIFQKMRIKGFVSRSGRVRFAIFT